MCIQWRIQDFPEGGAWTLQGGREHAKFSRKLHEIERIWTPRGGRASLTPPPRSANGIVSSLIFKIKQYKKANFANFVYYKKTLT